MCGKRWKSIKTWWYLNIWANSCFIRISSFYHAYLFVLLKGFNPKIWHVMQLLIPCSTSHFTHSHVVFSIVNNMWGAPLSQILKYVCVPTNFSRHMYVCEKTYRISNGIYFLFPPSKIHRHIRQTLYLWSIYLITLIAYIRNKIKNGKIINGHDFMMNVRIIKQNLAKQKHGQEWVIQRH